MKKIVISAISVILIVSGLASAEEADVGSGRIYSFPEMPPEFDVSLGYRFVDYNDSKRAEEYEYLEDSITGAAELRFFKFPHRLHLDLDIKNKYDYFGDLSYAYKDIVLLREVHRSIFHNLENIYLGEAPAVTGTDVQDRGKEYDVNVGTSDASLRLKAPNFPLHIYFKGRLVQKEGDVQQRFLGGSGYFFGPAGGRIRVSTVREIDWKTTEYTAGINSHLGPIEADFSHSEKKFDAGGDDMLSYDYGQAGVSPVVRPAGTYPLSLVPDTNGSSNTLKLHTMYTGKLVATATFSNKHRENEDSDAKVDYLAGSGSITWMPITKLTFFLKYMHKELDEDTPETVPSFVTWGSGQVSREAISSKTDTVSLIGNYKPFSRLTLKAGYTYETHDRSNAADWNIEENTKKNSISLSAHARIINGLKLKVDYKHMETEDPAYNITPDRSDEGKISLTWIPIYKVSTFFSYSLAREKRDHLHFVGFNGPVESPNGREAKRDNFFGSFTWLIVKDLSLTGSYSYMYNKIEQDVMYHTSAPPSPDFWDTDVPNKIESNVYAANIHYRWNDRLYLFGGATYTTSEGKFKVSATDLTTPVSIASFSELELNETVYSVGGGYILPGGFKLGAEYKYSIFEDKVDDPYDDVEDGNAQILWLYIGKKWG